MKSLILAGLLLLPVVSATSVLASTPIYNSKSNSNASVGSCNSCSSCGSCPESRDQAASGSECSKCSG